VNEQRVQAWYQRWNLALYGAVLFLALPAPYFLLRLSNDNAIENWLGDGDAELLKYRAFCREFGSSEFVLLALDDCAADDPRLEPLAEQIDGCTRAVLPCWTPRRVLEVQAALSGREGAGQAASFAPLTGRHPAFTAIFIPLKARRISDRAGLLEHFESIALTAGFRRGQLHWGGAPVVNVALDRWATRSLLTMLPVCGALVFALLWRLLGRLSLGLMVLFCSGWSTFVTVGLMAACGTTMNMFLVALPPMLLVLNLSFGIHLIHQWRAAPDARYAVGHAVSRTFMPTLFSALTTAIGAGSLATSRFAPVRAFGVWSAVGTMIAMLVTFIYIPSLLVGERRERPTTAGGLWRWLRPGAWRGKLLWGAVACALASSGLWRLRAEADALKFLPGNSATLADYRLIERRLCGLLPVEVIVETPPELDWQARLKIVRDATAALRRHPLVENVFGLAEAFGPDLDAAAEIVQALADSDGWRRQSASMLSADGLRWRVTAAVDSGHSENLETIVSEIAQLVGDQARVEITGLVPLLITAQREIFRSLLMSFLGAVLILVPVLSVHFRSLPAALVGLVPNVAPVAILFGLLGWLDRPLNAATLTTASIALGLALDNTLHLIAHFRAYRREHPAASRHDAVEHALRICHRAMIDTTLVAGLGLGVLLLSPFKPTAEFGLLLASLLACALLHDLLITPALLCSPLGEWFARGEPSPARTRAEEDVKSAPEPMITPHRRIRAPYEAVRPL